MSDSDDERYEQELVKRRQEVEARLQEEKEQQWAEQKARKETRAAKKRREEEEVRRWAEEKRHQKEEAESVKTLNLTVEYAFQFEAYI